MKISYVPLERASEAVHEVVTPVRSARGAAMQLSGNNFPKCPPPASLKSRPQAAVPGTPNGKPLEVTQIGD